MVKNDLANKRKNAKPTVKISNHAPTASFLGGLRVPQFNPKPNPGAAVSSRLQTKNLKCVPGGGFRVGSHASSSTVNQVRAESRPTVLDYLRRWSGIAFQNGWDQGYVDSFIEKQQPPPESDPETAGRPKGLGDPALHEWNRGIDKFMEYLITLEGRGRNPPACCQRCKVPPNRQSIDVGAA